ncbi:transcription initiation factor TFIID 23-30kDa subunit-domain-containing protein [Gorgonomyces haynaldii]|nr:transcription initiation factor TFIID 23-30kDa subunit-domain-containing protein [Gorgonomyces haynaldii]KAI8907839.1 transcription initiation factor TFIID 23-30kDa subunit-domain-containing protein [Gorgonomyces haynaldii]KAI8907886.1 transcription initiation factor TFIID 23-30kDa subunit-domain-containing protein [Gorgonomyces haynaldii]
MDKKRPRHETEEQQNHESLAQVLTMMQDYAPIIPDAVTDYQLSTAGFQTQDIRVKRLLALATQKFISDIASDALQFAKMRQQTQVNKAQKTSKSDKKIVLTMEDLSNALVEHGVNVKKPEFYL